MPYYKLLLFILLIVGCVFAQNASDYLNTKHTLGVGFSTNKSSNILEYTLGVKISDNYIIYGFVGFPTNGLGLTFQSNYNENGFTFGLAGGIDWNGNNILYVPVSYQWQLGKSSNFLSCGIGFGLFAYDNVYVLPIISFDRRF